MSKILFSGDRLLRLCFSVSVKKYPLNSWKSLKIISNSITLAVHPTDTSNTSNVHFFMVATRRVFPKKKPPKNSGGIVMIQNRLLNILHWFSFWRKTVLCPQAVLHFQWHTELGNYHVFSQGSPWPL